MKLVLDASAAIPAVLAVDRGPEIMERMARFSSVIVPELFIAEVANGLWKHVQAGHISIDTALVRMNDALALIDRREPIEAFAEEALREAAARRHPVYDMFYIVLARREQATLLTLDRRLRSLAETMGIATA